MHARVEVLFNGEAISAEKNDQAATEVTLARALLQEARENRELARLDLERAKAMLNQRTIKSPISGIVLERFVAPGEFVDNQPLLRVTQMDPSGFAWSYQNLTTGGQADLNAQFVFWIKKTLPLQLFHRLKERI